MKGQLNQSQSMYSIIDSGARLRGEGQGWYGWGMVNSEITHNKC